MNMNFHQAIELSPRQSAAGRNQSDIYVIYEKPSDYPEHFVVRRYQLGSVVGTPLVTDSLDEARNKVPRGRVNMGRMHGDAPSVRDVWL